MEITYVDHSTVTILPNEGKYIALLTIVEAKTEKVIQLALDRESLKQLALAYIKVK